MQDQNKSRYAAFAAKDARFDGHFFVGVTSTGIYCRPICRAKLPKMENCTFHTTAAAAEQAGFRPCLLCRPELAPGNAPVDAAATLAHRAARLLDEGFATDQSLADLAGHLGCTDRHLRRAFAAEFDVSPIQYLQTCRLHLVKSLLTDTQLSITEVAMAAGFGSLRRFNDVFQAQYRLAPSALRRQATGSIRRDHGITLALGYRPPYPWQQVLDFLSSRAIPGVEAVQEDSYCRTVRLATATHPVLTGWIRARHEPERNVLAVTVSDGLLPALPRVLSRIRHLFDLRCNPEAVYEGLRSMNEIRPGLCVLGTRLPGCFDPFEMAVRAVLGQQITVKGARTLAQRLVAAYGLPLDTGIPGLTHAFPSPGAILALEGSIGDHLGPLGITGARARTILALADAFESGTVDCAPGAQPEEEVRKLLALPGIGPWTAQYIAMRGMGWPDAFPHTDYGVKKALAPRSPEEILALAEAWLPWRGYATINLWNAL